MEQLRKPSRNHRVELENEVFCKQGRVVRRASVRFRITAFAVTLLVMAGAVLAHGNKVHLLGTIEKVGKDSVWVKGKDGKTVEVKLVASTVYLQRANNEDKPAKLSDLAAGDLVVIHATPKENTLEADEVKFTVPGAPSTGAAAPSKPKS